jgi:hypothetical protein
VKPSTLYEPDRIPRPFSDSTHEESILSEATEICLRCHRSSAFNRSPEFANLSTSAARKEGKYAISKIVCPIEEVELTNWALQRNILFSNEAFAKRWIEQGKLGGAENDIYYGKGRWVKRNSLRFHSSYLEFFYRLSLQNYFFPSCPVELFGFVRSEGKLLPLFRQPDIVASRGATAKEVAIAMSEIGFKRQGDSDDYYNEELDISIEDLHDQNALINESGMEIIDPVTFLAERGKAKRLNMLRA